jgi:hypothetical protein
MDFICVHPVAVDANTHAQYISRKMKIRSTIEAITTRIISKEDTKSSISTNLRPFLRNHYPCIPIEPPCMHVIAPELRPIHHFDHDADSENSKS